MSTPLDGTTPKYLVAKSNGEPIDPDARYLTLRIDNKPEGSPERVALAAYLDALEAGRDWHPLVVHLRQFFRFKGYTDEPKCRYQHMARVCPDCKDILRDVSPDEPLGVKENA